MKIAPISPIVRLASYPVPNRFAQTAWCKFRNRLKYAYIYEEVTNFLQQSLQPSVTNPLMKKKTSEKSKTIKTINNNQVARFSKHANCRLPVSLASRHSSQCNGQNSAKQSTIVHKWWIVGDVVTYQVIALLLHDALLSCLFLLYIYINFRQNIIRREDWKANCNYVWSLAGTHPGRGQLLKACYLISAWNACCSQNSFFFYS